MPLIKIENTKRTYVFLIFNIYNLLLQLESIFINIKNYTLKKAKTQNKEMGLGRLI
jgi:hypothetical protein